MDEWFEDEPDNRATALDLAKRGFAVFPITRKADGSWTPIKGWQSEATGDPAQVERLWSQYPDARVGLPAGPDNGVTIIDVDVKDGKDGLATLRSYGYDPDDMTPVMVRSPSGGRHLFFAFDERLKNWVGKLGAGLDVRTAGGFVLAPGSHKDGRAYEPIGAPLGAVPLPAFPEDLIPDDTDREIAPPQGTAADFQIEWAKGVLDRKVADLAALREDGSGRNGIVNDIAMWAGGAAAHGMLDFATVEAALLEACRENGHATTRAKQRSTRKTIEGAWRAGLRRPISGYPKPFDFDELEDLDDVPALPAVIDLDALFDDDLPAIAPAQAEPSVNPNRDSWRKLLALTEGDSPQIIGNLHNVELIIANDDRLYGRLGYNMLANCMVLTHEPTTLRKKPIDGKPIVGLRGEIWQIGKDERESGRRWIDANTHALRAMIEAPKTQGGYGIKVADRDIAAALENVARRNSFHPVREHLRRLQWDGVSRLEGLFVDYLGAEDTMYHRQAAWLFCLGAVARAFEPGHKFDFVPILEGDQGLRKSTFVAVLGGRYCSEFSCDLRDNKSVVETLQGGWLYEIPELSSFGAADTRTLKAVVSRTVDRARLSYGRLVQDFPRQCVFIGSTNEDDYLKDTTGGRRFWPVRCTVDQIDTDRLAANVDQIWAEAVAAYDALRAEQPHGGTLPLYMTDEAAASEAKAMQESRRSETPEDILSGEIAAALDLPISTDLDGTEEVRTQVCVKELWIDLLGRTESALESVLTTRLIGKSLRMAGWVPAPAMRHPKYGVQKAFKRKPIGR